ncbi:hypothetical protein F5880DRAFT_1158216 [Lentinula raphanica]|nr:hypothetical protein F5880DRAFT_1158216 [Lentinula raphanica]
MLSFTRHRRPKSSSLSLRLLSVLLLLCFTGMTRASSLNTRPWLDGVLNPSNAGEYESSHSENPPPDHEEPAHGAPSYVQPAHDAAPPGRYVASPYGQPTYGGSTHGYEAPSYGQPPPGVAYSHGVSPHGQPAHGGSTHRYEAPSYGQPPPPGVAYSYGVSPYGQPAHGGLTHGYEAPSYGQPPPGVATYSYGVSPHGQPAHGGLTHGYEPSDGQPAYRASTDMTHGNVSPHNQPAPAVVTHTYGIPLSYDRSAPASHGNEAPSYGQPASGVATYGYGEAALDIIFIMFAYSQGRNLSPHIAFEIVPGHLISLETIPYTSLAPSRDKDNHWSDWWQILEFNDDSHKYGRKNIGTVIFHAGNAEDPKTIMDKVADAVREDIQNGVYEKNYMFKRLDFSDQFLKKLKDQPGVDIEQRVIVQWTVARDQYKAKWKAERTLGRESTAKQNRKKRQQFYDQGLDSTGKKRHGATRARKESKTSEAQ